MSATILTRVESLEFPTTGGETAFGLFYPPRNPDYEPGAEERPPLLVKCHGGPTSAASSTLNLGVQYWTSRGIAVLDVNYRGSTGFGRAYRDRLQLNWGVVDVDDCVAGARFLAAQGRVDGQRCVISGGSAGGYTTLAALTFRDFFQGGASYYGVSDIAALARDTHKFESRYLDWLIGSYPQEEARYRERSPLYHADRLTKPVIFFQGDEDAVVPPNQAETMGAAAQGKSGRLFSVLGRAAWLPQGRQHSALPGCGTRLLCDRSFPDRAHVLTHAAMTGGVEVFGEPIFPCSSRCCRRRALDRYGSADSGMQLVLSGSSPLKLRQRGSPSLA
jgi:dienelactone hydrolase